MSLKFAGAIIVGRRGFVDVETDGDDEGMRPAGSGHKSYMLKFLTGPTLACVTYLSTFHP